MWFFLKFKILNITHKMLMAIIMEYICLRQVESAEKVHEKVQRWGWQKGANDGSEVMGMRINSARVAEFLYMR